VQALNFPVVAAWILITPDLNKYVNKGMFFALLAKVA
jgi:hypothetical protein